MEQVEHDGLGWRLHVAAPVGKLMVLTIEREINDVWVPAQRWSEPVPVAKHRRSAITESARTHGWITPTERWPRVRKDGDQVIEDLFPFDWARIVTDTTQLRTAALEDARRVDEAWRSVISSASAKGLSAEQLAALSGRGRHAIYRMRDGAEQSIDEATLLREARTEKRRG